MASQALKNKLISGESCNQETFKSIEYFCFVLHTQWIIVFFYLLKLLCGIFVISNEMCGLYDCHRSNKLWISAEGFE